MFRTRASKIDPALLAAAQGHEPTRNQGASMGNMIPPGELPRALANVPAEARAGYRAPKEKPHLHDGGLLDSNGVVNCGRVVTLNPSGVIGQRGAEVRILELSGMSKEAQACTIFLGANPTTASAGALSDGWGNWPVVASIKFAVGGGTFTEIEFDVPFAVGIAKSFRVPAFGGISAASFPNRGVVLTVPASSVIVSARLDAYVRSLYSEINSEAQTIAYSAVRDLPMNAYAYAAYNFSGKGNQNLFRTVVLYNNSVGSAGVLAPAGTIEFCVPPFTRRIFFRGGTAAGVSVAMTAKFESSSFRNNTYTLAAGSNTAVDVMPDEVRCTVTNAGAVNITDLAAVCELSL